MKTTKLLQKVGKALEAAILEIVKSHQSGISEYDLIRKLQASDHLPDCSFHDYLPLFRLHFVVYHTLYRLRNRLWKEEKGHLEISALNIALRPYKPGKSSLAEPDPLSEYYLNLDNLENTKESDVITLLSHFWDKFHAGERRQLALTVMELEEPVDFPTIKRQYRRLAKRHHPDHGGDKRRLQQVNEAMEILKKWYA